METSGKDCCYYQGIMYPDGSKVHGYLHGMVCSKGEWQDFDEEIRDSEESLAYNFH